MSQKAFTLVEVLVSMLIVAIMSSAAWFSIGVLTKGHEVTRNRIDAVNLLRKSQEEVRRYAQFDDTNFNNFQNCNFNQPKNTCSFVDTTQEFSGFTRSLNASLVNNSSGLKRAHITVSWNEFGNPRQLDSVVLLSQPALPLPGNLVGLVTDSTNSDPIINAQITLTKGPATSTTKSTAPNNQSLNYTFASTNGSFQLQPGNWVLTATHTAYQDTAPVQIIISSNTESEQPISMVPKPTNGTIKVNLTLDGTSTAIDFNASTNLHLLDDGNIVQSQPKVNGSWTFSIPFDSVQQKCFTVATEDAYKSGFVGKKGCEAKHNPEGFSSANENDAGDVDCVDFDSNTTWKGSLDKDRICVNPGMEAPPVDIKLIKVPTTRVFGVVQKPNGGGPIANAEISVTWGDGTNWKLPDAEKKANTDGEYSVTVPAAQDLFPDTDEFAVRLRAKANIKVTRCCAQVVSENQNSPVYKVRPLNSGTEKPQDMTIETAPQVEKCGDADGNVLDALTGNAISGATINIGPLSRTSATNGYYIFECSVNTSHCLEARSYFASATKLKPPPDSKPEYYSYDTSGTVYLRNDSFKVKADDIKPVPVPTIRMLQIGEGTITGTVTDGGTGGPIEDAVITISGNDQDFSEVKTDSTGTFIFTNVLESWPSSFAEDKPNYNQTSRDYTLNANAGAFYSTDQKENIKLKSGEITTVNIQLFPKGSM